MLSCRSGYSTLEDRQQSVYGEEKNDDFEGIFYILRVALFSYCLSFPTSSHKACKTERKETRDFVVVVDLF